jgi:Ran GTPase-activating protein (RanGAP) involved in mRNA processing and transport
MPNLLILNISKNELGLEGGRHLAKQIPKMKKLQELILPSCNITDRGIIEILESLDELTTIEALEFGGN